MQEPHQGILLLGDDFPELDVQTTHGPPWQSG